MNPAADNFFVPHTKDPFYRGALRMVIGGFPRSGTTWVSATINGLKKGPIAGHEEPFRFDGFSRDQKSDRVEVSVSGFLTPYLEDLEREGVPVVNLVRNPVGVVNSCMSFFGGRLWTDYREDALYVANVWMDWTQKMADYSKYLVRLEDLTQEPEVLAYVMQREGIELDDGESGRVAAQAERRASKPLPDVPLITAKDLPQNVLDWAKRLGYTSLEAMK